MLLKLTYDDTLTNFAFNFNLRRYTEVLSMTAELKPYCMVGRCRLTVSKPVLKAPMVSALDTIEYD